MRRRTTALVIACLAARVPAQEVPSAPEEKAVVSYAEQIVVTATRTEQPAGAVPGPITLMERDEIRASGARTVDEVLRRVPGFALFRDTSSVAVSTPTLSVAFRGLGGTSASRALVLVDGVPLNDAFGGWVQWPRVPVSSIERVEVVRGGSVMWGNLATGGLINIVTQSAGSERLALEATAGNRSTYEGSASVSGGSEGLSYGLRARAFDTDGTYRLAERQRGPIDETVFADHEMVEGVLDVRRSSGRRLKVKGGFFGDDRTLGDPGSGDTTRIGEASVGGGLPWAGGDWQFHGYFTDSAFTARSSSVSATRTTAVPATDQFDVPSKATGGDVQWIRRAGRQELSVGIDGQWVSGETNEDSRYTAGEFTRRRRAGGEQFLAGAWLQDIVDLSPRWRVLGAARLDAWRNRDGFRDETDLTTGRPLTQTEFESNQATVVSPKLGLVYRHSRAWTWRAAAYGGFRAPTLNELYRPVRATGDSVTESNAGLDPERLRGAEAGFSLAAGFRFRADTTLFWTELDEAVFSVTTGRAVGASAVIPPCGFLPAGGSCRQRQNVGLLRSRGAELTLDARIASRLSAFGNVILLDTEVTSAPRFPQLVGKRARAAAGAMAGAGLRFTGPKGLSASVEARWIGPRYDDDLNTLRIGESFALSAALERDVWHGLSLVASGQNLLDRENPTGRNGALEEVGVSRLVRVGLRYRLGPR